MLDLERAADWMSSVTPVRVEVGLCVQARSPRASCRACEQVCPAGAVSLERGPQLKTDICTGCGLCVAACATGAMRLDSPSDTEILAAVRKASGEPVVLACRAEAPALGARLQGRVVAVPCIGAVPAELLAGMVAGGTQRLLLWRSAACDACPAGAASDQLAGRAVESVEALYPGAVTLGGAEGAGAGGPGAGAQHRGSEGAGACGPGAGAQRRGAEGAGARRPGAGVPNGRAEGAGAGGPGVGAPHGGAEGAGARRPGAGVPNGRAEGAGARGPGAGAPHQSAAVALDRDLAGRDRRAFLGGMVRGGGGLLQALLGDWFIKPREPEAKKPLLESTGIPRRREVLAAALRARGPQAGACLPERAPAAGPACTLCPVCSKLCPAGALSLAEEGDRASLRWRAVLCTGCGLCRETCPVGAMGTGDLISAERFTATAPEVLLAAQRAVCACGTEYWQAEGGPQACVACRMRSAM